MEKDLMKLVWIAFLLLVAWTILAPLFGQKGPDWHGWEPNP